jgi:hypothetical protein
MNFNAILRIYLICTVNLLSGNYSLRFYGNGVNDIDRVKIKIDSPSRPVDVRGSFTIEFWMKASHVNNNGIVYSQSNGDGWITGNVIIDRDIYGQGDWGDFGISIGRYTGGPANHRVVAFGIDRLGSGITIRGITNVADTLWHHIAVTRDSATGIIRLFVDGVLESMASGPVGDISYRDGRPTSWPNSDPFLVIGAEKHDAGTSYPSFNGFIDELRISSVIRYTANFQRPNSPFVTDSNTVGLYHFDEGSGDTVYDVSAYSGGPSNGVRRFGGNPSGPVWSTQTPFSTTSINKITEVNPFYLYQNYPNPFNSFTRIKFSVNEHSRVTLRVYDQLGREVITIIDNYLNSGLYETDFHAQNLSSGIYFYELNVSGTRQRKAMSLIK